MSHHLGEGLELLDPGAERESVTLSKPSSRDEDRLDDAEKVDSRHGEVRADVVRDGDTSLAHLGLEDAGDERLFDVAGSDTSARN